MTDETNVVPIRSPETQASKRERMIGFLRGMADDLAQSEEDVQIAIALFVTDGKETDIRCGGFTDDQAAIKYLTAFIRNQGFAP